MKPAPRTRLRIILGKWYYQYRRYLSWYFGNFKFARTLTEESFPHLIFSHQTPLLRKLKNVDMWLQQNKTMNLSIAAERLNGLVISPEETFSFWRLIGKPTKRKGYVDGMNLFYGRVVPGIGGGLCQLTNLLYWMTLHTPLTVTERHRHSFDVFPDSHRSQPFGSGATCAYNFLDLQVYNNTDHPYQLRIYLSDRDLIGEWRSTGKTECSYEVYEKEHWITHEYWGGYVRHNKIHRRIYNEEMIVLKDEYVTENHAIMMYQPLLTTPPGVISDDIK